MYGGSQRQPVWLLVHEDTKFINLHLGMPWEISKDVVSNALEKMKLSFLWL